MATSNPNSNALAVLQNASPRDGGEVVPGEIRRACDEVANYHAPVGDQATRHQALAGALSDFLYRIVANCPPGADRSNAIRCAREAKHWASAAVALENS